MYFFFFLIDREWIIDELLFSRTKYLTSIHPPQPRGYHLPPNRWQHKLFPFTVEKDKIVVKLFHTGFHGGETVFTKIWERNWVWLLALEWVDVFSPKFRSQIWIGAKKKLFFFFFAICSLSPSVLSQVDSYPLKIHMSITSAYVFKSGG